MKYTAAHWGAYEIVEGGPRPIQGDAAPSRIGKGWISAARDAMSRILKPAIRKGWLEGDKGENRCCDSFVQMSWDQALTLAAAETNRVTANHGNASIFGGSYGWSSAGRFHHAQSQLRRFLNLNGGFVGAKDTYSHAAAEVLFPRILGLSNRALQDQMTSLSLVQEHCELLLVFGGITQRTAQIASAGTTQHEIPAWIDTMHAKGARLVNVSPQKSDLKGSEWWSIRPGTDTALMLALMYEITVANRADEKFLQTYTSGWDALRAYLLGEQDGEPKTACWAANLCDLTAHDIRALAMELTERKSMIALSWGIQRADHGEQPLWAGVALACVIGQIGQPGTGFAFGYGSTTPVGRPNPLIAWPSFPQGTNPVDEYIPVARLADMLLHPKECYAYNGEERYYPDIKMVWWAGGNPFHHHQDLNRLEEAWVKPDTVIVNDHSWTATARRADIVFPATTPLERTDLMINRRDRSLLYMSPLFEPMGEAKDDFEIFRLLSQKMGFEADFTKGLDQSGWLQRLWREAGEVADGEGFQLPSFEAFKAIGRFDVPKMDKPQIALKSFVEDPRNHPLNTESGRITLHNEAIKTLNLSSCPPHPMWLAPCESLIDERSDGLHLISGQPDTRLHSQNDRGSEAMADKVDGREPVYMHPEAAQKRNLSERDIVRIFNDRGACLAGLRLTTGIRNDCVALATGAWFDSHRAEGKALEIHGNPNVLTIDKGCSELSQGTIAHTAIVWIEKWQGPLPEISINRPPELEL